MQPDRGGTGAAVVYESDGAGGGVFQVGARVGGGKNQGGGIAFVVFEHGERGGGFVGNGLAAEVSGVVGDPGFFFGSVGGRFGVGAFHFDGGLGVFVWFLGVSWDGESESEEGEHSNAEKLFHLVSVCGDSRPQLSPQDFTQGRRGKSNRSEERATRERKGTKVERGFVVAYWVRQHG